MRRYWQGVFEPLLLSLKPKTILEIGSDFGENTRHLADFCQTHSAVLQAIDPDPKFDVSVWERDYAGRFIFHRGLSLAVLPLIGAMDVVLIDGDHNWYTVFHELQAIAASAHQRGCLFPLVFLHDVGWPYGRRDLYYAPLTIPEAYRQPYRCAGMRLNSSGLHETGGLNAHMHNAVAEGGAHNGVLTAVEDFLKTSTDSFQLAQVPGFYGLGILASQARLASNPQLAAFIPKLEGALARAERIRALESQRLAAEIVVQNLERPAWPDARLRPLARLRLRAARLRYKLVARTLSQSLSHWIEHS